MAQFVMYQPITIDRFHKAFVSQYVRANRKFMPDYCRKKNSEAPMNEARDFKKPIDYNLHNELIFTSYGESACGYILDDEEFDRFV